MIREGADEEPVSLILDDGPGRGLDAADQRDAGKDWVGWEGDNEGLFDVKTILDEDEDRVRIVRGENGLEKVHDCG